LNAGVFDAFNAAWNVNAQARLPCAALAQRMALMQGVLKKHLSIALSTAACIVLQDIAGSLFATSIFPYAGCRSFPLR